MRCRYGGQFVWRFYLSYRTIKMENTQKAMILLSISIERCEKLNVLSTRASHCIGHAYGFYCESNTKRNVIYFYKCIQLIEKWREKMHRSSFFIEVQHQRLLNASAFQFVFQWLISNHKSHFKGSPPLDGFHKGPVLKVVAKQDKGAT